jgi:hypothetical protein
MQNVIIEQNCHLLEQEIKAIKAKSAEVSKIHDGVAI